MDGYREHPSEFEPATASDDSVDREVTAAIGTDERRMHVRAYNYWVSLLDGRDFPSIEDLEPGDLNDFSAHSVLLDFTCGRDNPATPFIGTAIREECGLDDNIKSTADVPSRSLLSRLTDHYMQIIANRAPVGFEAEFVNQRGIPICYRGILMPFSSDGDTIDFIYGVINWKQGSGELVEPPAVHSLDPIDDSDFEVAMLLEDELDQPSDEENAEPGADFEAAETEDEPLASTSVEVPFADAEVTFAEIEIDVPDIEIGEDAGLADRLWAARETAEAVKAADGRSRVALYRALSQAYDFAIAAEQDPQDYAELLEESGVKAQARAPMTPVVKLVFGVDYDKARLTEFAAALSFAKREQIAPGEFENLLEKQPGGLKALVAAERQARRPGPKADTQAERALAKLRSATAIDLSDVAGDDEFSLVLVRRSADGGYEVVAVVADEKLLERAIRKAA